MIDIYITENTHLNCMYVNCVHHHYFDYQRRFMIGVLINLPRLPVLATISVTVFPCLPPNGSRSKQPCDALCSGEDNSATSEPCTDDIMYAREAYIMCTS